ITSLSLSIMATRQSGGVGSTVLEKHPAAPKTNQSTTTTLPPAVPNAPPVSVTPTQINPGDKSNGKPSVTLTDPATGKETTFPIPIPPPPGSPNQAPAPAKK